MAGYPVAVTEILADLSSYQSGDAASAAFAAFAADARDEVVTEDHPSSIVQYVDGVEGADLSDAKVPGVIRFEFGYTAEIIGGILEMLVGKSPYAAKRPNAKPPTHYRDEHAILVDGQEVTDPPMELTPDQIVTLVNLQPYSRKIERGFSVQAPNGVYEVVARAARQRWGNVADIEFGYDIFPGLGPNQTEAVRSNKAKSRKDDRFPTITVRALQ